MKAKKIYEAFDVLKGPDMEEFRKKLSEKIGRDLLEGEWKYIQELIQEFDDIGEAPNFENINEDPYWVLVGMAIDENTTLKDMNMYNEYREILFVTYKNGKKYVKVENNWEREGSESKPLFAVNGCMPFGRVYIDEEDPKDTADIIKEILGKCYNDDFDPREDSYNFDTW